MIKRGDTVKIIDKEHSAYGDREFKVLSITKHKHNSRINIFEIQDDISRYFVKQEHIIKI